MSVFGKAVILGNGRIARAVDYYFHRLGVARRTVFDATARDAAGSDLIVGALPGELGAQGLQLALRHRVPLIDISDIDPPFYLKQRAAIAAAGITVIPGGGVSPGLMNFLLGGELAALRGIRRAEVLAGSLSRQPRRFPFLWCFEDLVLEHRIPSRQKIKGATRTFPAFAGYRPERYCGIEAESYYCASGFENVFAKAKVASVTTRVVRPKGFREFFGFLDHYAFLDGAHLPQTKAILEGAAMDNITLGEIRLETAHARVSWLMRTSARAGAPRNSMQVMTAAVPAVMARLLAHGQLPQGLVFMEDLGVDERLRAAVCRQVSACGISVRRTVTPLKTS